MPFWVILTCTNHFSNLICFREHLISSQFFSKRNAFQIGFTPSLPPLSERLIAHFLTIIDVVLPQDLVYPRRNCSKRVSCPSPQEKLQPTTSSPLLSRFLRSPSLCTHRLLCAWPPTVHQRQTRSIAGNELHGGAMSGPVIHAKAGQAGLRPTVDLRAAGVDLPGFEQWQSRTFALDPNFESFFFLFENFPFLSKMCDLWFSIRN